MTIYNSRLGPGHRIDISDSGRHFTNSFSKESSGCVGCRDITYMGGVKCDRGGIDIWLRERLLN